MRRVVLGGILLAVSLLPAAAGAAECEDWVATAVSVQGTVEARRAGDTGWAPGAQGDRYCLGDTVRVRERSRAALALRDDTILRLDQNTTITFSGPKDEPSWLTLLRGAVHFLSRVPRGLRVLTPFVNGTVEGTEFLAQVTADQAVLTVFEGRLAAENAAGRLELERGQSLVARTGQAPTPFVLVRPRDAVQWALHYPPVLDYRPADFPDRPGEAWRGMARRSIESYRRGDLAMAFASLEGAPPDVQDPRFFVYRAVLLLSVGRVTEARADLEKALALDPRRGEAYAAQAVIAVARNETAEALRLARVAVESSPDSAGARVALSYARQAAFDLAGALASLQEAVRLDPDRGLAWARLAEVWLSLGKLTEALRAAEAAAQRDPDLARTRTVLGFAYLAQQKTRDAQAAFEHAVRLDQAEPLARLGLGLAKIRRGDLEGGRRELEIAAGLDVGNALIRSYLGKAYYEEKRDKPASEEFAAAEGLDPRDPTPWFYDAIRKQSVNRPVEALRDLQEAIARNDNRAIYRSRLLLDEDLAARSASLARIYDDLGFQKLALVEGWKSLGLDPGNHSAHRVLADSYSALPRHEIARVSELLQAQLLQPLSITPLQPRLGAANLFILDGAGPADPAFNEFNPLFNRNRLALQLSGVFGGDRTFGDEAVHSAVWGNLSYSLGQFHYETRGPRANADLTQDIYNVFVQARLTHATSVQAEFRHQATDTGDLGLRFDPDNFTRDLRQTDSIHSIRLGLRHAFAPSSEVIASFIYQFGEFETRFGEDVRIGTDEDGYTAELQHLFRSGRWSLISGAGHFNARRTDELTFPFFSETTKATLRHSNVYVYSLIRLPGDVTATLGLSADFFSGGVKDRRQVNPKLGATWTPLPGTTLRAAAFRTVKRSLVTNQTIEPTQVAGFNQFFDDGEATDSWRYGIGVDQKVSADVHAGAEFSWRKSDIPLTEVGPGGTVVREARWKERLARAYLYWTPTYWLALSGEYQYEHLDRDRPLDEGLTAARTHRVPLTAGVFHPSGFRARLRATFVDQSGTFEDAAGDLRPGADRFWVVDASIGYRLPKRWGIITLEAKNLLDSRFRFQDTDAANPRIAPERLILGRFTLAY